VTAIAQTEALLTELSIYKQTSFEHIVKLTQRHAGFTRALARENDKLRAFAQGIMEAWPEGSGLDGDELQDIATKHGILAPEILHEPCREFCYCAEYAAPDEWIDGVVCYRKTALLLGENNG